MRSATTNVNITHSKTKSKKTHRISWLLSKNLGKLDHVCVVIQCLGEVNHGISSVLLIAWPRSSKKRSKCSNGCRIALRATTSSILPSSVQSTIVIFCSTYTSFLPLGSGIRYNLSDPLCQRQSMNRSRSENERKQSERPHP